MQRASPASSRCSGVQASSAGIGEPPRSLVAVPSRSTETAYENVFARIDTEGNLHSRHGARAPRRDRLHGPARAGGGAPRRTRGAARRTAARGAARSSRKAGEEVRVADARDESALRDAFRGAVGRRVLRRAVPRARRSRRSQAAVGRGCALPRHERGAGVGSRLVQDGFESRRDRSSCRRSASITSPATWLRDSQPSRSTARWTRSSSRTRSKASARAAARGARSARS